MSRDASGSTPVCAAAAVPPVADDVRSADTAVLTVAAPPTRLFAPLLLALFASLSRALLAPLFRALAPALAPNCDCCSPAMVDTAAEDTALGAAVYAFAFVSLKLCMRCAFCVSVHVRALIFVRTHACVLAFGACPQLLPLTSLSLHLSLHPPLRHKLPLAPPPPLQIFNSRPTHREIQPVQHKRELRGKHVRLGKVGGNHACSSDERASEGSEQASVAVKQNRALQHSRHNTNKAYKES